MDRQYFDILGISPTNSFELIKKAFKEQIFKWHPDRAHLNNIDNKVADEKTKRITEAFNYIKANYNIFQNDFERDSADFAIHWESRIKVTSSNLDWVEYYFKLKILLVSFKKGGIYMYENVPSQVYLDLMNAPSKGRYLNKNIAYNYVYHSIGSYNDWHVYASRFYKSRK